MPSIHLYKISGCLLDAVLVANVCSFGNFTVVCSNMWSVSPCSVAGSYSICWVGSVDIIKSMHDYPVPLQNVWVAGGPGWRPFKMNQPYSSHNCITQGALELIIGSRLVLCISSSPIFGYNYPILVFQSPHIMDWEFTGIAPVMSSMRSRARSSSMPLRSIFSVGGKYTFPIQSVSPPLI